MRRQSSWICLGLFVATAVVYSSLPQSEFITLDEGMYVTDNLPVLTGLTASNTVWAFTDSGLYLGHYCPLVWLSLQSDATLFGPTGAWGFHLVNLACHLISVQLFFLLLVRMTQDVLRSGVATALFAIHPLRVESVAWITQRRDVMGMLFLLFSLAAYLWYVERPGWQRYVMLVFVYVIALLAKVTVITLPFALLLLDYWPLNRWQIGQNPLGINEHTQPTSWQRLVLEKLPLLAAALALTFGTLVLLHTGTAVAPMPLMDRAAMAASSYLSYLEKTFWPANLAVIYPLAVPPLWHAVLSIIVVAGISVLAVYWSRTFPPFIVGWFWFLGTLVPLSGIIQIGPQSMADRFTYVPHLGLFIALVWGCSYLRIWQQIPGAVRTVIVVCLLAALGVLTWKQTRLWRDSEDLFAHTLRTTESNALIHYGMALCLQQQGRLHEAEQHYEKAYAIAPFQTKLQLDYGYMMLGKGKYDRAVTPLRDAAAATPGDPRIHYWLGTALTYLGMDAEARSRLREAFRLWNGKPLTEETRAQQATARLLLGRLELRAGKASDAIQEFDYALALQPLYASAYEWKGVALGRLGRWQDAEATLSQGVALNPSSLGLSYLAYALEKQDKRELADRQYAALINSVPDWPADTIRSIFELTTRRKLRDLPRARELAEQICSAAAHKDPIALDALAVVQAAEGNFDAARATARQALSLAGDAPFASRIQERLRRYEQDQSLAIVD